MVDLVAANQDGRHGHIIADAAPGRLLQNRIWKLRQIREILHNGLSKQVQAEASPRPIGH